MSVFTGIMILIMWFQSCQTQISLNLTKAALKQSEDSGAQAARDVQDSLAVTKKGVEASERSAKSAEDAVRLSGENVRQEQRAWVGIREMHVGGFEPDHKGNFSFYYSNFGRTPAFNVKANMGIFFQRKGDTRPERIAAPFGEGGTVFPNSRYNLFRETRNNLTFDDIQEIRIEDVFVYAMGIITYKDSFGNPHTTRFCARLSIDVHGNKTFRTCGFHDSAD